MSQHGAKRLFDLLKLRLVGIVIHCLALLVLKGGLQSQLICFGAQQLRALVFDNREPDSKTDHSDEHEHDDGGTESQWPTADIIDVKTLEFVYDAHTSSSSSASERTCFA